MIVKVKAGVPALITPMSHVLPRPGVWTFCQAFLLLVGVGIFVSERLFLQCASAARIEFLVGDIIAGGVLSKMSKSE